MQDIETLTHAVTPESLTAFINSRVAGQETDRKLIQAITIACRDSEEMMKWARDAERLGEAAMLMGLSSTTWLLALGMHLGMIYAAYLEAPHEN